MFKKFLIYSLFFFITSLWGQRQSTFKNEKEVAGYLTIPKEKIFIHYNTSLLFSGSYLYYRVYCFNNKNNLLSDISKIAYIELIDQKKQSIFKHKVQLKNGLAQGDFFLPVDVPSGNYKLIGYTQWMLNAPNSMFFQGDISILNPYQGNQKPILLENKTLDSIGAIAQNPIHIEQTVIRKPKNGIALTLHKEIYKKRSPVSIEIFNTLSTPITGNLSISVRKKSDFSTSNMITSIDFFQLENIPLNQKKTIGSSFFLPEMRGELIYGTITPRDTTFPVSSVKIALSVPGTADDVKIVSTDKNGKFIFNLDKRHNTTSALIQVLGKHKKEYRIKIHQFPKIEYPSLDFYNFKITRQQKETIISKSIYNQIDNIFFNLKPDSIQEPKIYKAFYGAQKESYELDDFTRFPTIKETVTEIVNGVGTRKNKNGDQIFIINGNYPSLKNKDLTPLLIVDGILIQEHEQIMEYDARKVKSIHFIRDRYFLGSMIFEGILSIETIDRIYQKNLNKDYFFNTKLSSPKAEKKYFQQIYNANDTSYDRIPDYRYQLLWEPAITLENDKKTVRFFTSDIIGEYEISLEGFTDSGLPISMRKYFKVE